MLTTSSQAMSRNQENILSLLKDSLHCCFSPLITKAALTPSVQNKLTEQQAQDLAHIMLTISGIKFRALVLLHYFHGKNAVHYLQTFTDDERSSKSEKDIEPFYLELGNQFCGEIKRHLYKQFDHLGMSTPAIISRTTQLSDIQDNLLIAEGSQYYLSGNDAVLGGSIFIFSNQPILLDIPNLGTNEVIATGELEFF